MATFSAPDIDAARQHPIDSSTDDNGYCYVSTSQAWKDACAPLPSCAALQWPGYATTCIEANLRGVEVIIQPWMGHCEQFLFRSTFPGGFGGEVGIYVREDRGAGALDSPLLSGAERIALEAFSAIGAGKLWWPRAELQPEIEFTIINPIDHSVLVRAPRQASYWVNKWMEPESYAKYCTAHHVPRSPTQYKMVFTVDGVTRAWTPSPTEF